MLHSTIPTQLRINDPYQQRLLQFDTQDSRVYLSRVSNYILKSIGNDAVIKGLEVTNINLDTTTVSLTIAPGLIIQDSTLIELTTETEISFDLNGLDSCNGYLILYTNYQYLNVVDSNKLIIKLSYITKDGLDIIPSNDLWDKNRNRIYLGLYRFDNAYNLTEILNPDFFYVSGKIFYRRGKLNFLPVDDTTSTVSQYYYQLPHNFNSDLIFTQLFDETYTQKYINTLRLSNSNNIDISIDEYKDFDDYYQLLVANPIDVQSFEILKSNLDINYQYTLIHNYDQKYVQVQVYNDNKELIHPRFVKLLDNNSLLIDFSNLKEDLAATYQIKLIKDITIQISDLSLEQTLINHNLNKFHIMIQIVNNISDIIIDVPLIILNDYNSIFIDSTVCNISLGSYTILLYKKSRLIFNLYNNNTYSIPYNMYKKQFTMLNTLLINHNLNTLYPLIQLFDENKNIVIPDQVIIIDLNSVSLSFSSLVSGIVIVYSYNEDITPIDTLELDENYTKRITTSLNPIFQLYNSDNTLVIPNGISKVSDNIFDITLSENDTSSNFILTATEGFERYVEEFDNTSLSDLAAKNIIHNLNTWYPIVQIYSNNQIILPKNIQVININTIQVLLSDIESNYEVLVISGIQQLPIVMNYENSYIIEVGDTDLIDSKLLVSHNLNCMYPIVQVYNNNNKVITLNSIQVINNNQIQLDFSSFIIINFYKVVILRSS